MAPDRSGNEDRVACAHAIGAQRDALANQADARGGDEDAVALAALDHLGVAGRDRHAGLARGGAHRIDDALQRRQRQALLEHQRAGERERPARTWPGR